MSAWSRPTTAPTLALAPRLADACLRGVDAALGGILFIAPLVFSGRHDLGRFVFIALVAVASSAWFIRQALLGESRRQRTAAYGLIIAAISLVAAQLVPLPVEWIARLSPRNAALLPLWSADGADAAVGQWRTLSLSPTATRTALAMLVAYGMLFVTVVQRLQSLDDVSRLLRGVALAAVAAASLALVQYATSNGRYFWFYKFPYYDANFDVVGSFLNKNHFAHFVVLGVGPLLAILVKYVALDREQPATVSRRVRRPQSRRQPSYLVVASGAGLALAVFAVLLSLSRGGALGLAAAGVVALGYYWRRRAIDGRLGVVLAALTVAVVGLLTAYGYDRVANRLDDFADGSLDALDAGSARRQIWSANAAAIRDGGLFGAGAGSHAEVHGAYLREPSAKWFTYAENGYLQVLTENGLAGGLLLAAAMTLVARWCVVALRHSATPQSQLLAGAVAAGLAASAVHSLVDFVWYVPACMSLTVILAASALRLAQLTERGEARGNSSDPLPSMGRAREGCEPSTPRRNSFRPAHAAIAICAISLYALAVAYRPARAAIAWDRYQLATIAQAENAQRQLRDPNQSSAEAQAAGEVLLEAMITHLEEVVRLRPDAARAHQRLSRCYMHAFELHQVHGDNAMPIAQIGDAAMAANFPSPAELQRWLGAAFGEKCQLLVRAYAHARRAAELAPLIPDTYVQLAKLGFLEGRDAKFAAACVDQALRLGPHDGDVLYEAGVELGVLGDWDRAIRCWQAAFRADSVHQLHIIQSAPGRIPVASFLATLRPDWNSLGATWAYYSAAGTDEAELALLASYAAQAAHRETPKLPAHAQARVWQMLGLMRHDLQQLNAAIGCFERAAATDPNNYTARRLLALSLMEAGQPTAAEPHLRWCLSRRPDDARIAAALAAASRTSILR